MMQELIVLGVVGSLMAILTQTGAMFYWGGKISATVAQHDKRLSRLEDLDDERDL